MGIISPYLYPFYPMGMMFSIYIPTGNFFVILVLLNS
jgi:hypothetical protein